MNSRLEVLLDDYRTLFLLGCTLARYGCTLARYMTEKVEVPDALAEWRATLTQEPLADTAAQKDGLGDAICHQRALLADCRRTVDLWAAASLEANLAFDRMLQLLDNDPRADFAVEVLDHLAPTRVKAEAIDAWRLARFPDDDSLQ